MPNSRYLSGVRVEREVVNRAREKGLIAFRSAGSHSPFDVVILDKGNKVVTFLQCKSHKKEKKIGSKIEFREVIKDALIVLEKVHFYRTSNYYKKAKKAKLEGK